jgi:hypothetical protein
VNDLVNQPPHYTSHPSGVECITVTEHMNFCLGNAVKYIWRAGEKGDAITDLRKSIWYIEREITRLERAQLVGNYQVSGENSLADADRALAAELLASLAEWERTSGPPVRENSPTPATTAAEFYHFASNCDAWQANATMQEAGARSRGEEKAAAYAEGQAEGFQVAGMMARMLADSLAGDANA